MNKNVTTRLFEKVNGDVINPGPGTVADSVIVESDESHEHDFYMVANDNPTGATALPVHYSVITNTTGISKRDVHVFVHQQCYSYQGFGGPIKVPAAVMYAHKKAMYILDNEFLKAGKIPNRSMSHLLHFI